MFSVQPQCFANLGDKSWLHALKRQPLTVPASLSLPAADSHCSSLTWKRSHSCLSSDFTAPTFPQRFPTQPPKRRRRVCLQLAQMSSACLVRAEFRERGDDGAMGRRFCSRVWVRWVRPRVENVKNEPWSLRTIVCICTHCHVLAPSWEAPRCCGEGRGGSREGQWEHVCRG